MHSEIKKVLEKDSACWPSVQNLLSSCLFLKIFFARKVYTVCTRINYKTVPVTSFNKYLQYGTSATEKYVYINIDTNNDSEKL